MKSKFKIIEKIKDVRFTRRANLDLVGREKEIKKSVEEVLDHCYEYDLFPCINRIYKNNDEAILKIAQQLRLDLQEDRGLIEGIYKSLVETGKLYKSNNGLVFDFRLENLENDDFMALEDAMAFLRLQIGLDVNCSASKREEMLNNIFHLESYHEVETQGKYAMFWFDAIEDEDGSIKFNMELGD